MPTGRDILLLHGLASNALLWAPAGKLLANGGHRVIAADLRGHGQSDKPDTGYSMHEVADEVALLVKALGLESPIVIGQSWGGNVVIEVARRHSDVVSGIVAVDGGTIHLREVFDSWDRCVAAMHPPHLEGTPAGKLRAAIRAMRPGWSTEAIDGTMANMEVLEDGTIRPWLSHARHVEILRGLWDHDPFAAITSNSVPTLFTPSLPTEDAGDGWSRHKLEAQRRVESLPNVRVEIFWDADHDLHAEQPGAFADAVESAILEGFFG